MLRFFFFWFATFFNQLGIFRVRYLTFSSIDKSYRNHILKKLMLNITCNYKKYIEIQCFF